MPTLDASPRGITFAPDSWHSSVSSASNPHAAASSVHGRVARRVCSARPTGQGRELSRRTHRPSRITNSYERGEPHVQHSSASRPRDRQAREGRREDQGGHHHPRHRQGEADRGRSRSPSATARSSRTARVRKLDVKVGDRVLFGKYGGTEVKIDGEERLILREDDILGVAREVTASLLRTRLQAEIRHMAAKEIVYTETRPQPDPRRRQRPRRRREGHPRPQGPQRRHREELRLPDGHQGRRDRRQGDRAREPLREHGRPDGARSRVARRATSPATARRPPPCSRRRSTARAASSSPRATTRWRSSAASTRPSRPSSSRSRSSPSTTKDPKEIEQVGTISANGDKKIGKMLAEAMEKVGKEGVITVEESKTRGDDARSRRGHAVRPRLPLAVLRHRSGAHGGASSRTRTSSSARRRSRT